MGDRHQVSRNRWLQRWRTERGPEYRVASDGHQESDTITDHHPDPNRAACAVSLITGVQNPSLNAPVKFCYRLLAREIKGGTSRFRFV